jgi:hypothetical protein
MVSPSGTPYDAHITNPEALNAIAQESRRTRRTIAVATLALLALAGGTAAYLVTRAPAPAPTAARAESGMRPVAIESEPPGARVEWNDRLLGETPLSTVLPTGVQSVRIVKEGFAPETLAVTVSADEAAGHKTKVTLKPVDKGENAAPPSAAAAKALPATAAPAPFGKGPPLVRPAPSSAKSAAGAAVLPAQKAVETAAPPPVPAPAPSPVASPTVTGKTPKDAPAPTTHVKVIGDKKTNVIIVD